jgi:hypothetical protein
MEAPRKEKKRKTGRPLEGVPMRSLVQHVKRELRGQIRASSSRKSKPD